MSQLHFYVPKDVEQSLRREAASRGLSLSKYLADLVRRDIASGWPADFFSEVVGGWKGEPLERAAQGEYETRDPF